MNGWDGVVAEVARMPGVADRLLAEHTPDAEGRCTACTSPGYGRPSAPWPCSLHRLAVAAVDAREPRSPSE